jgi:predicted nucleic acid-binding protein
VSDAVVSDSSPLNYLVLIDAIDLLPRIFSRVLIPPAVLRELSCEDTPTPVRNWVTAPPFWLSVSSPDRDEPSFGLDDGEAEAIRLAQNRGILTLLIDERNGYRVAESLGLKPIGVLGILELSARNGWISFDDYIARIRATSFRLSEKLIIEARIRLSGS